MGTQDSQFVSRAAARQAASFTDAEQVAQLALARATLAQQIGNDDDFAALLDAQASAQKAARDAAKARLTDLDKQIADLNAGASS